MSRKDLNHAGNGRGAERIPPQCWRMEVALREDLLNAGGGWRRCSENRC